MAQYGDRTGFHQHNHMTARERRERREREWRNTDLMCIAMLLAAGLGALAAYWIIPILVEKQKQRIESTQ